MLKVKLLNPHVKPPTIGHPGEDLGYDLYSTEFVVIPPFGHAEIGSGICAEYTSEKYPDLKFGFLIQEKSSYSRRRLFILGGVCDAGYRGEFRIVIENNSDISQVIDTGDKIANLIPIPVFADEVSIVEELSPSLRGDNGYGSTGLK